MKAIVKEIQVGGGSICHSLEDACREYVLMVRNYASLSNFPMAKQNKSPSEMKIARQSLMVTLKGCLGCLTMPKK